VVAYSDDTPGNEAVRTYRNAILVMAPDPNGLEKAIQRIQRLMAAEAIEHETPFRKPDPLHWSVPPAGPFLLQGR
jgi:hypothetical protein